MRMARTQWFSVVLLGLMAAASLLGVAAADFVEPTFHDDQPNWQMVRDLASTEDEASFDRSIVHELSHSDREHRAQLASSDGDDADADEFDVGAEMSLLERMQESSPLAEDQEAVQQRRERRAAKAAAAAAAAATRPQPPPMPQEEADTEHHTERAATLSAREFAHAHARARRNAWAHAHEQHGAASSVPSHFRFRALGDEAAHEDDSADEADDMMPSMFMESGSHARLDDEFVSASDDEDEEDSEDSEDDEEAFDRETEMLEMRRRHQDTPRMRFARTHARGLSRGPLPKDRNGRLFYAKSQRGQQIRRMIRRGDMLYRYAPELMNKVLDPGRITPPGITPSFAMAMNGPLGPLSSPPFTASSPAPAGEKPNSKGPAVNTASPGVPPNPPPPPPQEEGKDKSPKEIKPHQLLDKAMAQMDQQLRLANVPDQATAYPHLYRGWDNYMYPMRNRPLPPRFYPYPTHMSRYAPVASFPPPKSLFDHPLAPQPVLQQQQPLFHNPSRSGTYGRGLQPVPAPFTAFAGAGVPSPSPYMQPIGFTKGSVMGPKNHAVFPNHPVPLEKWYSRFEKPAEPPKMTEPPKEGGGGGGEEKEGEFFY